MVEDAVWGLHREVGAFKTKVSVTLTDGRVLVGVLMAVDRHRLHCHILLAVATLVQDFVKCTQM